MLSGAGIQKKPLEQKRRGGARFLAPKSCRNKNHIYPSLESPLRNFKGISYQLIEYLGRIQDCFILDGDWVKRNIMIILLVGRQPK